jgi:hypothetical protein
MMMMMLTTTRAMRSNDEHNALLVCIRMDGCRVSDRAAILQMGMRPEEVGTTLLTVSASSIL